MGYNEGCIAGHVISVLYRVWTVKNSTSSYYWNLQKWAALLHDICKKGAPLYPDNLWDPVHPFVSGIGTLIILKVMGFIELNSED